MKVLILGGSGMLGHKLWQNFAKRFDVYATLRKSPAALPAGLFDPARMRLGVSTEDFDNVRRVFEELRPQVVVNCIGVIKQDAAGKDPVTSITVNSLFPQRLAKLSQESNARLIHVSTDCVFSGRTGNYREDDSPDAEDLYGRSKLLGEVTGQDCITIRTSMIGRELIGSHGLLEWFLSQQGRKVRGFKRAIFSGFTTQALADLIAGIITDHPRMNGLWHVGSEPISKFDLLTLVKQTYELAIEIEPDNDFVCDRSLDSTRFRQATGIQPPAWPEMIENLRADPTPYEEIRSTNT